MNIIRARTIPAFGQYARFQRSDRTPHVPEVVQHPDDRRLLEQRGGLDSGCPSERRQWYGPIIIDPPAAPTVHPGKAFADNASNTLADVAMYYWNRDLRPELENKVRAPTTGDPAFWQHMVNFTVGLGVDGTLLLSRRPGGSPVRSQALAGFRSGRRANRHRRPLARGHQQSRRPLPQRDRSRHLLPGTFRGARRHRQPQRQRSRRCRGQPRPAGGQSQVPALLRHRSVDRRHQGHRTRWRGQQLGHHVERRHEVSGRHCTQHPGQATARRSSPRAVAFRLELPCRPTCGRRWVAAPTRRW